MGQPHRPAILFTVIGCVISGIAIGVVSAMVWRQTGDDDYVTHGIWAGVAGFFFLPMLGVTLLALGWIRGSLRGRLSGRSRAERTLA